MNRPLLARSTASLSILCLLLSAGVGRANPIANPYPDIFSNLAPGGSIQVSGASHQTGAGYDGEGYVVGPNVGGSIVPFNLKSYNGMNFLMNDGSDRIRVTSSFPIYSISFDYE